MDANAITTFRTPTRHVGRTPYCGNTGKAVWKVRPRDPRILASEAEQLAASYESAFAGSGLDYGSDTYTNGDNRVVAIGSRDTWNVIGWSADGFGFRLVIGCQCHAREIAQHLAEIACPEEWT